MKKKAYVFTLCGLLALSGPMAVFASVSMPQISQEEPSSGTAKVDMDEIIRAVQEAVKQDPPDIHSQVMEDFLAASNAYDALGEDERGQIPADIRAGMETVRDRIGEVIHRSDGVTANSRAWYAKTEVTDGGDWEPIKTLLKETYESASPRLVWYKEIRYIDLRTGEAYAHYLDGDYEVSLTFPAPEGYEEMTDPQVFTRMGGKLLKIVPERDSQGDLVIRQAAPLTNVIVVDLPIALTGIALETEAKVNAGQKTTLQASPLPQDATQAYEIVWTSSDPLVAQVDAQGTVSGKKTGTALITASVRGSDIRAVCCITVVQGTQELETSVEQVMEETRAYMLFIDQSPTVGSEWFVVGLARSGLDLNDPYLDTFYNHFANYLEENDGVLTRNKYTEYSKAVVTMTAIGRDARDIAGYDLLKPLADFGRVKEQGINGPIWALIALHTNPVYTIPQISGVGEQTTEEGLVDYILSQECPGGGWNLAGGSGDTDMTGMALQALAPYYKRSGHEDVTAAIDRALAYLSAVQNPTGGFSTAGNETVESCVQVLTGLCALGIDPQQDSRFIKGGHWLVENLLTYHIPGSGFMHVKPGVDSNGGGEGGAVNGMATEQGYYAMTAYARYKAGDTALYDMSDIQIQAGEKGDGTGTGIQTPTPAKTPAKKPSVPDTPAAEGASGTDSPINPTVPAAAPTTTSTSASASGTRTYASPRPTTAVSQNTAPAVKQAVSSNDKKKKKDEKESPAGWDFQGETYDQGDDPNEEVWDFEAADVEDMPEDIVPTVGTDRTERAGYPFILGLGGGAAGAGILELAVSLYRKKRKKAKIH